MLEMINELKGQIVNNPAAAAVTVAASGYVLNLLKGIPASIWQYIKVRTAKTIFVQSFTRIPYKEVEYLLGQLYPHLIERHNMPSPYTFFDDADTRVAVSFSPGTYTTFDKKHLSFVIINKETLVAQRYGNTEPNESLTLTILGFGKPSKTLYNKFNDILRSWSSGDFYDKEKFVKVTSITSGDYNITLAPLKRREWIFDSRSLSIVDKHLEIFLGTRKTVERAGDIWKTGILLHGKPGTGKSMMARYIAHKLGMGVVHVRNLRGLPVYLDRCHNSVILLEELDLLLRTNVEGPKVFGISNDDENLANEGLISLLLQFMDGITSPRNVIFFATTNDISALPPALLREGRFDLKLELNGISKEDAKRMCAAYGCPNLDISEAEDEGLYNPAKLSMMVRTEMMK